MLEFSSVMLPILTLYHSDRGKCRKKLLQQQ